MDKKIILFLLIISANFVFAQKAQLKKADKYYESLAYVDAAKLYEKIIIRYKSKDKTVIKRLADCYNKINDYQHAEIWYKKINDSGKALPEELYNYAQALKANGKYPEAEEVLKKFQTLKSNDSRGEEFIKNSGDLEKLKNEKPYFKVVKIEGNSSLADFSPALYKDQIVFVSGRKNTPYIKYVHSWDEHPFLDLFIASIDSLSNNLLEIKEFNKPLNTQFHEGPTCFNSDGTLMFFTRNNYFNKKYTNSKKGINMLELFRARLKDGKWIEEKISFNSDEYSIGHPALTPDGKNLYFVSDMPGGVGATDIYKVEIKDNGEFGVPVNLGKTINTEGEEMFPSFLANGTLFFSSNGHLGFGNLDVFAAIADSKGEFTKIINLGLPLNSGDDDFGIVLTKDDETFYFSSNRAGGMGEDDIYSASLLRPIKSNCKLKGQVTDVGNNLPLANTTIVLKNSEGEIMATIITGEKGEYEFDVESGNGYYLSASANNYFDGADSLSGNESIGKNEVLKNLVLKNDPGMSLYGLVVEEESGQPLDGVKIVIIDNNAEFVNTVTGISGDFKKTIIGKKIGEMYFYTVKIEKEGYLGKTFTLTDMLKSGENKFTEKLSKIKVGMDLAKMINLKPIYFDLGKSNIRTDASIELDKIVQVMNEYPNMVIELGSHTDCRSSTASNMALSEKRARASAAYIIDKGISNERIYGKGYGETKLLNGCACEGAVKSTCSEDEHKLNRRTEFIIVKMN